MWFTFSILLLVIFFPALTTVDTYTDYQTALFWLDEWWKEVKAPTAEDWMTRGLVQILNAQNKKAAESFEKRWNWILHLQHPDITFLFLIRNIIQKESRLVYPDLQTPEPFLWTQLIRKTDNTSTLPN